MVSTVMVIAFNLDIGLFHQIKLYTPPCSDDTLGQNASELMPQTLQVGQISQFDKKTLDVDLLIYVC